MIYLFREIRSECSGGNVTENEELTDGSRVSPIEDKTYSLISTVKIMETSFDSKGDQKLGCCGVLTGKEATISTKFSPADDIVEEIGHLPGQKWPHVISRQSSFVHYPVKVIIDNSIKTTLKQNVFCLSSFMNL